MIQWGRASFLSFCFISPSLTMDHKRKMTREEELLRKQYFFINNASFIIQEMVDLSSEHTTALVDEVLHSIFFLGRIQCPRCTPEEIVGDEEMLNFLKVSYPRPFDFYCSQLPTRSPFSCVLDMIVHQVGQENEDQVREELKEFISQLDLSESKPLVSSTICVSQTPDSDRYYGVSMSSSGSNPGRIMVAASCLHTWDSYVAGSVMTYYPVTSGDRISSYFDGTIKLPTYVRCQAFDISKESPKPPCESCGNLFGLQSKGKGWPYGNCAEIESLSKLFKNETEVKNEARPQAEMYTVERRQMAEESIKRELLRLLRCEKFKWDSEFYEPDGVSP